MEVTMIPLNKFKFLFCILVLGIFTLPIFLKAQEYQPFEDLQDTRPKMFAGGNFLYANKPTKSFGFSPVWGLHIFPDFGIGLGADYYYAKRDEVTIQSYGGKLFIQYNLFRNLYAKSQFSYLYHDGIIVNAQEASQFVPYLFVGGGYQLPIARQANLEFEILYDLIQDEASLFEQGQPVFNAGLIFVF
jgi:hypothetical protein